MANSSPSSSKPLINQVDWYAIASKIRIQNEKLKAKIDELETIIEEQKQQIKVQVIKNQDYFNTEENQQEKIKELEKEIAEKNEQINNQKSTINELTQELENIQQHTASLERECSLLQESYNEQKNQLKKLEQENKELKIRLQRQQRYNIQYKTALDQVINASSTENANGVIKSLQENDLPPSLFPNKIPLNSPKPEEIISNSQPIKQTNNVDEFPENSAKIESFSRNQNEVNNPLDSSDKKLDNFSSFLKKSEIIDDKIQNPTPSTTNHQPQEEIKPKRRMFIQLPQFGKKKEN